VVRHPLTYALSLGVYATSWTYSGSVGFARSQGYAFLTIYLGVTLACLLVPVLWEPVLRLCREHQLTSLADLFAFRFQSQGAGVLVTVFMLAGNLPTCAADPRGDRGVQGAGPGLAAEQHRPDVLRAGDALRPALRRAPRHSPRERHAGLGVAIAFESLVKLVALLTVGLVAVTSVFGGLPGSRAGWPSTPRRSARAYGPVQAGPGPPCSCSPSPRVPPSPPVPHGVHRVARRPGAPGGGWAFPLFLLLLNLPVLPLLWSGMVRFPDGNPDNHVLALARSSGHPLVGALAFIGAISAASSMLIVDTLALAAMCLNHLVLPAHRPGPLPATSTPGCSGRAGRSSSPSSRWATPSAGCLATRQGLVEIGLISFVAVAQVLPGLLALLFWRGADPGGFLVGCRQAWGSGR
jgi:hypothetical protein